MAQRLWTDLTATNSPPVDDTSGVPLTPEGDAWTGASLFIWSTAGTTPTVTAKLWVYLKGQNVWFPAGPSPAADGDATKFGLLNDGIAIGPYVSNTTRFTDLVNGLGPVQRVYLECTAISGATATFQAEIRQREDA